MRKPKHDKYLAKSHCRDCQYSEVEKQVCLAGDKPATVRILGLERDGPYSELGQSSVN